MVQNFKPLLGSQNAHANKFYTIKCLDNKNTFHDYKRYTMSTKESFRVSEKLGEQIEKYIKNRKITKTELYTQALKHFFTCRTVEPSFALREICLKYRGACRICKKDLKVGDYAMWGRGAGAVCLECHAKRYGAIGSVRKYMKSMELSFTLKNLKIQCDEKALELRKWNLYEKMQELFNRDSELSKLLFLYLRERFADEEGKKTLEDVKELIDDQNKLIHDVDMFLRIPIKQKKNRVR